MKIRFDKVLKRQEIHTHTHTIYSFFVFISSLSLFVLPSPHFFLLMRQNRYTKRDGAQSYCQHYREVAFSLGKSHGTVDSYRMLWSTLSQAIKLLSTHSPHGLAFLYVLVYKCVHGESRGPTECYGGE